MRTIQNCGGTEILGLYCSQLRSLFGILSLPFSCSSEKNTRQAGGSKKSRGRNSLVDSDLDALLELGSESHFGGSLLLFRTESDRGSPYFELRRVN
jgi:hypothetical protein